jgi:hypothetical protein
MQRLRDVALAPLCLALMTMACGGSNDDSPPGSPDAASHADAASQADAASVDAATADAVAGECSPERTRQILSLIAEVPTCTPYEAEPVGVGSWCDDILTYASTPEQRAMIEAAAPGFVCNAASGYCEFSATTGSGIEVTAEVMMQLCAASLVVEAGCYIDCLVFI